jgi:hypothetical protein
VSEKLTEVEYRAINAATHLMAHLATGPQLERLEDAIASARHSEAFGVFADPTLWRDNIGKLQQDREALVALLAFRRAIERLATVKP